ncbi:MULTISPECIES: ABC transporter ATP-binding protein [Haloferax]|uniref:ATP-binding cassette domain-containing protein n=1 Tax=Haloferax marinum TaxID=2666143 RepID=A0A6A8G6B6_9EURY|nr:MULTISPECIES: ABC transporter ATP-binding protein [Haloferax]KAB1196792.1 ABC transporter ATP-binding protein [Haloferax sp. CBA1150]MRW95803.1 ATP-binding cassette domain-containing protein [Haloferax marinum]
MRSPAASNAARETIRTTRPETNHTDHDETVRSDHTDGERSNHTDGERSNHTDGERSDHAGRPETREPPVIEVSNLTKRYDEVVAVDDVSFSVEQGTILGVLGPNGAGKTTLLKAMLGLLVPTEGTVRVCGIDVHDDPERAYRRVGATLEGARNVYWRLTVRENLAFFGGLAGESARDPAVKARHDTLLDQLDLLDRGDDVVNELSRGMKQKVALACALARDVDVAFLDEPTLGLDVESSVDLRRELRRLADERGLTVVLTSHDMSVVEDLCDRVLVVNQGQVVADDGVTSLVELFRTSAVRIVVDGRLSATTEQAIRADYTVESWETDGDRTRALVALEEANDLPALSARFVEGGGRLVSVNTVEPDLTEAFLQLTGSESTTRGTR